MSIVKAHDGFLEVASEVGKGTTFFVFLPVEEAALAGVVPGTAGDVPHGRNERILVVDDEEAILEITRETLAAFNYRVLATSSSKEAIALFSRHCGEIDLVITDLLMPELDGPALVHTLRKIEPGVKIVAVSGLSRGVEDLKIAGFLKKPFNTPTLLKTIRSALDGGSEAPKR
jgi:hypothetical protein